jgi:hypothetical protein
MALADTARLVASLELKDQFTATANKFDKTLGSMERSASGTFGRIGQQAQQGLGTAAANIGRLALVGVGVIGVNVAAGIQSLKRLEEVTVATNAVIESTGGVAGITAAKVRELAEAYESVNATMDDKVIQSAENLLLTFTSINEDAFEPALEAALNMNQALGGGEEGLQGTIIQVGKALQDPIRGLTALRRVGVNFTAAQQNQIKALVDENKLYEAQQLILQELGKEFGGQFAAAGTTATAKFAKFKDAIEDAQMSLATAFLPVLEKVADKLTTLLADPAVISGIQEFGGTLADAFDSVVDLAGNLPWNAIGDAFRLMGTGSKALLQAFTSLPPWVQTAVLTGWGLNKLTGGALTGIVGTLASGLIKGILGINAGVVNINAATVNGAPVGGAPVATAGRSIGTIITKFLGLASAVAFGSVIGSTIGNALNEPTVGPARDFAASEIANALESGSIGEMAEALRVIQEQLTTDDPLAQAALLLDVNGVRTTLEQQRDLLKARLAELSRAGTDTVARLREGLSNDQRQTDQLRQNFSQVATANAERRAEALRQLQAQSAAQVKLQQIADKNFSPTVNVAVTSNVSITDLQRRLMQQSISMMGTIGGR